MAPRKNKNKTPRKRKEPTSLSNPVFEPKCDLPLTVSKDNKPISPSKGLLLPQDVDQSVVIPTNITGESAETRNYDANTYDPGPATPSQNRRNTVALTERRLQQSQDLPAFRHNNSGEVPTKASPYVNETIPTSDMEQFFTGAGMENLYEAFTSNLDTRKEQLEYVSAWLEHLLKTVPDRNNKNNGENNNQQIVIQIRVMDIFVEENNEAHFR
ncbi:hypothetical protein DPMN_049890 [Dreissena polymorpha]|uniref:Uncharacterized protein n=1 Tax=Dreissena polymorpha TaxID=45954 RepID=A0A9D4CGE5_DREPO|nr:hypothetical protein DPMN_049890 [Dreissena polymorpha]